MKAASYMYSTRAHQTALTASPIRGKISTACTLKHSIYCKGEISGGLPGEIHCKQLSMFAHIVLSCLVQLHRRTARKPKLNSAFTYQDAKPLLQGHTEISALQRLVSTIEEVSKSNTLTKLQTVKQKHWVQERNKAG